MAETKNITMKQYNGTDYDTLYPATIPDQIVGQIPASKIDGILSGTVPISNGGTGATTVAQARTNLGVAPIQSPTFAGTPKAPAENTGYTTAQLRNIMFSTTDLTAGTSTLASGTLYFVYE